MHHSRRVPFPGSILRETVWPAPASEGRTRRIYEASDERARSVRGGIDGTGESYRVPQTSDRPDGHAAGAPIRGGDRTRRRLPVRRAPEGAGGDPDSGLPEAGRE